MSMDGTSCRQPTDRPRRKSLEDTMKKTLLAVVAIVSLVFGTAAFSPEAHASKVYLFQAAQDGNG